MPRTSWPAVAEPGEQATPTSQVGARVPRREDARLLTGRGRFVDDVDLPGQLWMRVVRSTVANAAIGQVDSEEASALGGVHCVITAADLAPLPRIPIRLGPDPVLDPFLQPVLADGRVRYVGEPVAVVLANSPYVAEDAAELVAVAYDAEAAVVDPADASAANRVAATIERGEGDVQDAFARAAHVVEVEVEVGRHTAVPMETRGLVAFYERVERRLTIWGATKVPHFNRGALARLLDLPKASISMRPSDAGGGFGVRGELYPEDVLVPFLAVRTGRPVKWIEDRVEHLTATNHSRQQRRKLRGAFDADGRLLGLDDEVLHDNGAYLRTHGVLVPQVTLNTLPGPYRVPAYQGTAEVALTNKTPCGTYRAPGHYEAAFARERLLDAAAAELQVDPVELRRRNLLQPKDLPLHRRLPILGYESHIDVGDPLRLLDRTLDAAGFDEWREEAAEARANGEFVGVGAACFMEKSGGGPYEEATVSVLPDGRVRVVTGAASLGQGVETVMAQIAADQLGVPPDRVDVICSDTDLLAHGGGSWSSRSTMFSGAATAGAAEEVANVARAVAAALLEADVYDLVLQDGRVTVAGSPGTGMTLQEIATACDPANSPLGAVAPTGLTATHTVTKLPSAHPYGAHLAQVRVDTDTCGITLQRFFVGYEIGRAVNPTLVDGQLVGGAVQGIGGALLEELRYDDAGQPVSASFMDYLLPGATELPRIGTLIAEDAPSPAHPLGLKGAGEGGATAAGAAIAAAVDDALGMPGAVRRLPITPDDVCNALSQAR